MGKALKDSREKQLMGKLTRSKVNDEAWQLLKPSPSQGARLFLSLP